MTSRREVTIAMGLAAFTVPLGSFAQQQGRVWRIGYLSYQRLYASDSEGYGSFVGAFRELGYIEGKNLVIESRFADGDDLRSEGLAAELVKLNVDAIVVSGMPSALAAKKATATIPIVMANHSDPVGSGLVKSLAHPAGNITGTANLAIDLSPKHLDILLSLVPKPSRVAILLNPANKVHAAIAEIIQSAAQTAGAKTVPFQARTRQEIENAFLLMARDRVDALIVVRDGVFNQEARRIAQLAATNRLPSIAGIREYADAGCLLSYGSSRAENYRRAAKFVDKILKGAKPGDLPVEQPTTFELVINLKTAKLLGLAIPKTVLLRATELIE